jgi:RNA polymerase sigma factor (sigma-70 family)
MGLLYKVAYTYCRQAEERTDLVQEMALAIWKAFPTFDHRSAVSTWMHRIAINVAISYYRGQSRRIRASESIDESGLDFDAADALWANVASDELRSLHELIARLDDVSKAIILLFMEGYSHNEIASIVGTTPGNVATRIGRIKERLQKEAKTCAMTSI